MYDVNLYIIINVTQPDGLRKVILLSSYIFCHIICVFVLCDLLISYLTLVRLRHEHAAIAWKSTASFEAEKLQRF